MKLETPKGIITVDYSKLLQHTTYKIKPYEADKSPKETAFHNPPDMAEAHSTCKVHCNSYRMTKTVAVNLRSDAKPPAFNSKALLYHLFCFGAELISCILSGSVSTWHPELHTILLMPQCCHQPLNSRESFLGNDLINEDIAFYLWDTGGYSPPAG